MIVDTNDDLKENPTRICGCDKQLLPEKRRLMIRTKRRLSIKYN